MREILFKAKTKLIAGTYNSGKDDGEWVKGSLLIDAGKYSIRQFEFDRQDYINYEVDPETVCQYTGETDKNEKKIFEGDIIRDIDYGLMKCVYLHGSFVWFHVNKFFWVELGRHTPNEEVIGNIFDNPELLGNGGDLE